MSKLSVVVAIFFVSSSVVAAQEPEWDPARVKVCDRACLVEIMDAYMNAIFKRDVRLTPPVQKDVRFTENTAELEIGEGVLWRSRTEPTSFKFYVADPVNQQVAMQARLRVQGRDTLAAIRLRIDRGKILEIEHLQVGHVNPAALELLTTPRAILLEDAPPEQRVSREMLYWIANSYFDALEGDNGRIGAFADNCVRHEQGYRTVNNPPPGGRLTPGPNLPDPKTEQGRQQLELSMLTCAEQINRKLFTFIS